MIPELLQDARERMGKSIEATRHELATVRTGLASLTLTFDGAGKLTGGTGSITNNPFAPNL